VIHRCGVNVVLRVATGPAAARSSAAARTATTPPSIPPSSTGGASWSCIHIVFVSPIQSARRGPVSYGSEFITIEW
jgi:hypothetical protein